MLQFELYEMHLINDAGVFVVQGHLRHLAPGLYLGTAPIDHNKVAMTWFRLLSCFSPAS